MPPRPTPEARTLEEPAAAPWRVHWRIAAAWHHESFGRPAAVAPLLQQAAALAATEAPALAPVVALHLARLALARSDTEAALAHAAAAVDGQAVADAPLWHAHAADVASRVALVRGSFHEALHQARRCHGLALAARAVPAYVITFRLNEAYAQVGLGNLADAIALCRELAAAPVPAHLRERLDLLAQLFALGRALKHADGPAPDALATALGRLRELQWPGVLALLPQLTAQLWACALQHRIETDWVTASIRHRDLAPPVDCRPQSWPWALRLRVLGPFELTSDGASPDAAQNAATKAAARPLALLRRLAAQGGLEALPVDALAEGLWPGEGREGRQKAFEVTLARLRKQLGRGDALLLHERRLRLNPRRVWLDRDALDRLLHGLATPMQPEHRRLAAWHEALALWRGPLLADESPEPAPWLAEARRVLRSRLAAALLADAALPGHRSRCLQACAADPGLQALLDVPAPGRPHHPV